jgi:hypothetical protein
VAKPRKSLLALMLLAVLLLDGCSSFYDGEYSYVTKHEEPGTLVGDTEEPYYEVRTYVGMKNAVQSLISSRAETGTIRVKDYSSSVQDDIARVCLDATRDFPMGAYAVEYISHSVSRILGYDEVNLRISYRLTQEEMSSVRAASTLSDVYSMVENAVENGLSGITIQTSSLSVKEQALQNYLRNLYRSHPEQLTSEPKAVISFYPSEESIGKIVDFTFTYREEHEEALERLSELRPMAEELARALDGLTVPEQALYCCNNVVSCVLDTVRGSTAYDALILGNADSEGCAMAYQLLCNLCGIDCRVVEGRMDGSVHYWNIIGIDGAYYHVDCSACVGASVAEGFIFNDGQMMPKYWWDVDKYPACNGPITIQQIMEMIFTRQVEQASSEEESTEAGN